jgi:hypothetical protein
MLLCEKSDKVELRGRKITRYKKRHCIMITPCKHNGLNVYTSKNEAAKHRWEIAEEILVGDFKNLSQSSINRYK